MKLIKANKTTRLKINNNKNKIFKIVIINKLKIKMQYNKK